MTLLIACILLYHFGMAWWWYVIAFFAWGWHLSHNEGVFKLWRR